MKTGDWVRKAAQAGKIVIMDRKRPVAQLVPFTGEDEGNTFANRQLVNGFAELPKLNHESTDYLSEDRERS